MQNIDYKSFGPSGDGSTDQNFDKRWWLANKTDRADSLAKVVTTLGTYDSVRQAQYQTSTRLYGNTALFGVNAFNYAKGSTNAQTIKKERVTYNVVQSCGDTITAKIAKNRPKPLFLTSGGNVKQQRKAKKLDKFIDGVFYENNAYKLGTSVFRDGFILGDGLIHVFKYYDRVKMERALATELYVDPVESFYGEPRQLHRIKNIDRSVLIDMFPEKKAAILRADGAKTDLTGQAMNISDQVTVGESWHLPSGPDATDGMHVIWLTGATLFEEAYTKQYFPFARFQWCPRQYGFWSQGGAEQIQNIQLEINKLLWVIQRSMHLAGTFKVWMKTGTKIPKEHLNNDIGAILVGEEAPQYLVPPIVAPEIYNHLTTLKAQAYEQIGVSQLSANSQKPSGLNSGKALREFNDIESDRFMTVGQAYERLFLDAAKIAIDVAKEIYEEIGEYSVKVPGKKFIETIDWEDVNLDEDSYVMKIFPVSSLPQDPAGRLQTVQEYAQAGFIDPMTARKLLDFPDLEQVESLANAQEDWICKTLDLIMDDGEYNPPEPEMNLQQAQMMVLQYIAQGSVNNLDPEKLELLRNFKAQVEILIQKAMPPAPLPSAGGAAAVPLAPPQSDLLPNMPQSA